MVCFRLLYLISMIPKNINDVFKLGDMVGNAALFYLAFCRCSFLLFQKVKGEKYETTSEHIRLLIRFSFLFFCSFPDRLLEQS